MSSAATTERWKCTVAYDGTAFSGWQSQPDGNAIQDHLERRLARMFGAPIRIHGSGRTDAGVHARAQVFHFDAAWRHGPERLLAAFRSGGGEGGGGVPSGIHVTDARVVAPAFHARFDAVGKRYTYDLHHGGFADPFTQAYCWSIPPRLDVEAMKVAAGRLAGRHDFCAFSAFGGEERETTVRDLRQLDVTARGSRVRITARADGFLYRMVRRLVGGLVHVGLGKLSPDDIAALLAEARRTPRIETAPAHGLFLDRVFYGKGRGRTAGD